MFVIVNLFKIYHELLHCHQCLPTGNGAQEGGEQCEGTPSIFILYSAYFCAI